MNDQEIISVVNQVAHAVISASRAAADQAARVIVQSQEKSVLAMLGDYLREASVLVIIFVPVEILLPNYLDHKPVNAIVLRATLLISLGTLIGGIVLERLSAWLEERKLL